jgi:glycosyltransferase involved in cell wall biosynthesis
MNRLRILYLDTPFENVSGGDKNRSRFLWWALGECCETSLVLIGRDGASPKPLWNQFKPLAILPPQPPPFPRPAAAPAFSPASRKKFLQIVRDGKFDVIFCRFTVGWELLTEAARAFPAITIVVDVDMVSSRLVALTWAANPSFKKRWFLFEKWKLQFFERNLFRRPWLFLFTNSTELAGVRDQVAPQPAPGKFALLPNIMPPTRELHPARQPVILFFGSLDSSANVDGFNFLVDEVLPLIEEDLKKQQVKIRIVGKNPPAAFAEKLRARHTGQVDLTGPVDSMETAIAECLFVLLPLRIASGTRTRILEAAALGRAVVTTTIGAEGLDLGDSVLIGDTAADLAAHTRRLLAAPAEAAQLGRRLRERSVSLYDTAKVAADLAAAVKNFAAHPRKGAVR